MGAHTAAGAPPDISCIDPHRYAIVKGNADKAALIAAIQVRGFRPADDNEADAIALLLWAIATNGGVA